MQTQLKCYKLRRQVDISGTSGTGDVALVFELNDAAIVVWTPDTNAVQISSVVIYQSLEDLMIVHGHNGSTTLVDTDFPEDFMEKICPLLDSAEESFSKVLNGIALNIVMRNK